MRKKCRVLCFDVLYAELRKEQEIRGGFQPKNSRRVIKMGRSDEFHWVTDAEPHSTRRREILSKYGDKVRALYGYDHSTAVQVQLFCVACRVLALTNG